MEARMTPANELGNNKRFLAGLMFLAIGAVAIWMAQDYPIGSALRMGPGSGTGAPAPISK